MERNVSADPQTEMKLRAALNDIGVLGQNGLDVKPAHAGEVLEYNEVSVEVLHPQYVDVLRAPNMPNPDVNHASVVLRINSFGHRVLLAGDLSGVGWSWLLSRGPQIAADVLKLPHHGGAYKQSTDAGSPTLPEVLTAVSPKLVVVSVGTQNRYHHPDEGTMNCLLSAGSQPRILCTQATSKCSDCIPDLRETVRSLVPVLCRGNSCNPDNNGCPCAGTVTVEVRESGLSVSPTPEEHSRVVNHFTRPKCLPSAPQ
jgi:hypothetical protein